MPRLTTHRTSTALALTAAGCALLPAAALASTSIHRDYTVGVKPMALAHGHGVKVDVQVDNPEQKVSDWWSRRAVSKTVRKGIDGGYQTPYSSEGFRCTPVIRGETTRFTCRLRGADVPTVVTLRFDVIYRGDTRSG